MIHSSVERTSHPTATPACMATIIKKVISVSAVFLLGSGVALASPCASQGNTSTLKAEALLRANDSKMAYAWLNTDMRLQSGELGSPEIGTAASGEAYRKAASMFEQGRGVVANEHIAQHLNWMGAQFMDPDAMFKTAQNFFAQGNRKDGWEWAEKAKDCGHAGAVVMLIERSIHEGDAQAALKYLDHGISKGIPRAKFILAEQYDKGGLGLPKDHQRSFNWYYLAAKDGIAEAKSAIAYYFVRGLHGVQDDYAALHWYHEAAKAGHVESMTAYGWMLANGKGGQVDLGEANHYFKKAARQGDKQAVLFLKQYAQQRP